MFTAFPVLILTAAALAVTTTNQIAEAMLNDL